MQNPYKILAQFLKPGWDGAGVWNIIFAPGPQPLLLLILGFFLRSCSPAPEHVCSPDPVLLSSVYSRVRPFRGLMIPFDNLMKAMAPEQCVST